jgi:manganese oxidase
MKIKLFYFIFCITLNSFADSPCHKPAVAYDLPWIKAKEKNLPPGQFNQDFTPCIVPNGSKAHCIIRNNIKIFHLIAEPITWEIAKGLTVKTWGYNGSVPGPVIEVAENDSVKIYVTNKLKAPTTVHWHGVLLPCGMDGVAGLTQPAIKPGETFCYEFIFPNSGTFMYHPHYDNMTQEGMGLVGMIVVHKREKKCKRPDRDFVIMLHEWSIPVGTKRPDIFKMGSFNILTMNGKVMPDTEPLVAKLKDKVWIRYGNLSAMDHHPIHLHGYSFKTIGTDGGWIENKKYILPETTVLVPVGTVKVTEFYANNPGDWIFHCHMTHHIMNQMGHNIPNVLAADTSKIDEKIRRLIPNYRTMGTQGMRDMTKTGLPIPENSIPMLGYDGQFGNTVIGGMANILRVRENLTSYENTKPYNFPKCSRVRKASKKEMINDGINPS